MKNCTFLLILLIISGGCTWNVLETPFEDTPTISFSFLVPADYEFYDEYETEDVEHQYYFISNEAGETLAFDTLFAGQQIVYDSLEATEIAFTIITFVKREDNTPKQVYLITYKNIQAGNFGFKPLPSSVNPTYYGQGKTITITNIPAWTRIATSNENEDCDHSYIHGGDYTCTLAGNTLKNVFVGLQNDTSSRYLYLNDIESQSMTTTVDYQILPQMISNPMQLQDSLAYGLSVYGHLDGEEYLICNFISHPDKALDIKLSYSDLFDEFSTVLNIDRYVFNYETYSVKENRIANFPNTYQLPNFSYDFSSYVWNDKKIVTTGDYDAYKARFKFGEALQHMFDSEGYAYWDVIGARADEIDLRCKIDIPEKLITTYPYLQDIFIYQSDERVLKLHEYSAFNNYQDYLNFFLNPTETRSIDEVSEKNIIYSAW